MVNSLLLLCLVIKTALFKDCVSFVSYTRLKKKKTFKLSSVMEKYMVYLWKSLLVYWFVLHVVFSLIQGWNKAKLSWVLTYQVEWVTNTKYKFIYINIYLFLNIKHKFIIKYLHLWKPKHLLPPKKCWTIPCVIFGVSCARPGDAFNNPCGSFSTQGVLWS